jgi:hypothetical protein
MAPKTHPDHPDITETMWLRIDAIISENQGAPEPRIEPLTQ